MAVCVYLPGHLLGGPIPDKGDGITEVIVARVGASVAVATPVLVALAVWGRFTVWAICAALLVCAALIRLFTAGRGWVRASRWDLASVGLVGVAAALYSRPAEHIVNDRDPGVYAIVGAKLARSGQLLTNDPLVRAIVPFHDFNAWTKYPGFYIYGDDLVVPQFFPGPFAWLGLGNLLGGLGAELYVVPVFGVFSVVAAFALGRELFGVWAGMVGAALLSVSFAQVWWAREPSSEMITQFMVLGGLWLTARWLRSPEWRTGLVAGMLLGAAMLVRVDAFLALAAVPLLVGRDLLRGQSLVRWTPLLAPLSAFAVGALIYANTVGGRYLNLIYERHGLKELLESLPYLGGAAVGLAALWALLRWRGISPGGWLLRRWERVIIIAAFVFVGFCLWAYFIRPVPFDRLPTESVSFHAYDSVAAVRLVWAMAPAVALLGMAGLLFAAFRPTDGRLLLLGALAGYGIVYVAMPNVAPDLPWATRRFVPTVFPAFALLAGYAIVRAGRLLRPPAGAALSAALFIVAAAFVVGVALPVYSVREYGGAIEGMNRVNAAIPESGVVIVELPDSFDHYGSTLEYLYGRPVLAYDPKDLRDEVGELRRAGLLQDATYVTVDGEPPPQIPGIELKKVGEETVTVERLERTFKELPDETGQERTRFGVYTVGGIR